MKENFFNKIPDVNKKEEKPFDATNDNTSVGETQSATILKKIRESKITKDVLKALLISKLIGGGVLVGKQINEDSKERKQKIEAIKSANAYAIESSIERQNVSRFFDDNFISEVALSSKGREQKSLIDGKEVLMSVYFNSDGSKVSMDKQDTLNYERQMDEYKTKIDIEKKKLSEEEKNIAKEKIVEMISLVEQGKLELINHIQSDEYLEKLAKEMDISKDVAKEHQKVRINNIKGLSYEFKNGKGGIWMDTDGSGYAYYRHKDNKIYLPYDIDLNDKKTKEFFYETLIHEILHESTQFQKGMSKEAMALFINSFKEKDNNEEKSDVNYYSSTGELIVRKQILDLEMEKLGIKKYGEVFTEEHYKKLRELRDKYEISWDAVQLIDHIKPEEFCNMMNSLANLDNKGKNYYNSSWNYDEIGGENKA